MTSSRLQIAWRQTKVETAFGLTTTMERAEDCFVKKSTAPRKLHTKAYGYSNWGAGVSTLSKFRDVTSGDIPVYLTGISHGGGMVLEAASRAPERFRGIAPLMACAGMHPPPIPKLRGKGLNRVPLTYAAKDPGVQDGFARRFADGESGQTVKCWTLRSSQCFREPEWPSRSVLSIAPH